MDGMNDGSNTRPVLGAALSLDMLEQHRDWVMDHHRDLELQDFISAETLNGDWTPLADRTAALLDGHGGRLGIHGPFWGWTLDTPDPDVRAIVQKRLDQGLDICARFGATHMVIHSPISTWNHNNLDNVPGSRERLFENVHWAMADAVKRAAEIGCILVIENIEDI
ncbi:MAG: TIM barrel protein, partial [Pseudomonadota bacterium]